MERNDYLLTEFLKHDNWTIGRVLPTGELAVEIGRTSFENVANKKLKDEAFADWNLVFEFTQDMGLTNIVLDYTDPVFCEDVLQSFKDTYAEHGPNGTVSIWCKSIPNSLRDGKFPEKGVTVRSSGIQVMPYSKFDILRILVHQYAKKERSAKVRHSLN